MSYPISKTAGERNTSGRGVSYLNMYLTAIDHKYIDICLAIATGDDPEEWGEPDEAEAAREWGAKHHIFDFHHGDEMVSGNQCFTKSHLLKEIAS